MSLVKNEYATLAPQARFLCDEDRLVPGLEKVARLHTAAHLVRRHALPKNWWMLPYDQFLVARRPLVAGVIRQGYEKLVGTVA